MDMYVSVKIVYYLPLWRGRCARKHYLWESERFDIWNSSSLLHSHVYYSHQFFLSWFPFQNYLGFFCRRLCLRKGSFLRQRNCMTLTRPLDLAHNQWWEIGEQTSKWISDRTILEKKVLVVLRRWGNQLFARELSHLSVAPAQSSPLTVAKRLNLLCSMISTICWDYVWHHLGQPFAMHKHSDLMSASGFKMCGWTLRIAGIFLEQLDWWPEDWSSVWMVRMPDFRTLPHHPLSVVP